MLVSFSVANFRSIKEKQTIYLNPASKYSASSAGQIGNTFSTKYKPINKLLTTGVIYGANASGKSNLIKAVYTLKALINDKALERGNKIEKYDPFSFNKETKDSPCEFEIDFIAKNKIRYVYYVSFDREKIISESLYFFNEGVEKIELLYSISQEERTIGENFEGEYEDSIKAFRQKPITFLKALVNEDNNEKYNPVHDYIANIKVANRAKAMGYTLKLWEKEKYNQEIKELIQKSDVGILDLNIKSLKLTKESIEQIPVEDKFKKKLLEKINDGEEITIGHDFKAVHKGGMLEFDQESEGTQSLFGLAGLILPVLKEGGVLFFDELDEGLHPDLLIYIVKLFHSKEVNIGNGQLIFACHNDILLNRIYDEKIEKKVSLFRRDQVWFTSKNEEDETELYSLVEFKDVRPRDNIVSRYRDNDFGARPALQDFYWSRYGK